VTGRISSRWKLRVELELWRLCGRSESLNTGGITGMDLLTGSSKSVDLWEEAKKTCSIDGRKEGRLIAGCWGGGWNRGVWVGFVVERRRGRSEVQFVVVAERRGAMAGFEVRFWQEVIFSFGMAGSSWEHVGSVVVRWILDGTCDDRSCSGVHCTKHVRVYVSAKKGH